MTRDEYNLRRERGICVGDKSCPNPHAPGATICKEHQAQANGVVNAVRPARFVGNTFGAFDLLGHVVPKVLSPGTIVYICITCRRPFMASIVGRPPIRCQSCRGIPHRPTWNPIQYRAS